MAKKRNNKKIPAIISPFIWAYIFNLQKQKVPIKSAYLFGSWAKGKQRKWSDIDLAVISPAFTDWIKKQRILNKAKTVTEMTDIEAHGFHPDDFKPTENPMAYEVTKYGIKII